MSKAINADRDLQDIIIDFLDATELRLSELEEELHNKMISDETNNQNLDISKLKKRIKYCRNPLEKQSLQRELNTLYKKKQVRFLRNHLKISKKGVKIYNEI